MKTGLYLKAIGVFEITMYHKLEHIWNTLEHIHQQESANILEGRRSLVKLKARKFNSPINSK